MSSEADFIRFLGRKSEDEQGKIAHVVVGEGNLGLRPESSLLAVSNRFGVLFSGTAQGLRWSRLSSLDQQCAPDGPAAAFESADAAGSPFVLALSPGDTQLALLTVTEGKARLYLYDVVELLRGRSATHKTHAHDSWSSRGHTGHVSGAIARPTSSTCRARPSTCRSAVENRNPAPSAHPL